MSGTLAAALGGAAGAVALVGVVIIITTYCLLRRRSSLRTSETNSSDEGQTMEMAMSGDNSYSSQVPGARCFAMEELNLATKNFDDINLIGNGKFGEVYKGLLNDGTIVAIKRRQALPSQEFIQEVNYLASVRHRHIVSLLGYCQQNDLQLLVYEYIANGSVSSYLYGTSQKSSEKLEFKNRLLIAHGVAKGLDHIHSLDPPLAHMNFKTSNVLVDEDFTPKVADAGIKIILDRIGDTGPSSQMSHDDFFVDPEVQESERFSVKSDVYSFGVFLLELISGRETRSDPSMIQEAQNYEDSRDMSGLVDSRMGSNYSAEGMKEFFRLIFWCLNLQGERRPPTRFVALELDRIHEKEMSLTTIMGEGTTTVTLGSQLFTSSS